MEAVKQGSATVGLKSKTHAVLVALKVLFTTVQLCHCHCLVMEALDLVMMMLNYVVWHFMFLSL